MQRSARWTPSRQSELPPQAVPLPLITEMKRLGSSKSGQFFRALALFTPSISASLPVSFLHGLIARALLHKMICLTT